MTLVINSPSRIAMQQTTKKPRLIWFGLFFFGGGISTTVGYLMPNPFLYFKQFYSEQFSLPQVHCIVLFGP